MPKEAKKFTITLTFVGKSRSSVLKMLVDLLPAFTWTVIKDEKNDHHYQLTK